MQMTLSSDEKGTPGTVLSLIGTFTCTTNGASGKIKIQLSTDSIVQSFLGEVNGTDPRWHYDSNV